MSRSGFALHTVEWKELIAPVFTFSVEGRCLLALMLSLAILFAFYSAWLRSMLDMFRHEVVKHDHPTLRTSTAIIHLIRS